MNSSFIHLLEKIVRDQKIDETEWAEIETNIFSDDYFNDYEKDMLTEAVEADEPCKNKQAPLFQSDDLKQRYKTLIESNGLTRKGYLTLLNRFNLQPLSQNWDFSQEDTFNSTNQDPHVNLIPQLIKIDAAPNESSMTVTLNYDGKEISLKVPNDDMSCDAFKDFSFKELLNALNTAYSGDAEYEEDFALKILSSKLSADYLLKKNGMPTKADTKPTHELKEQNSFMQFLSLFKAKTPLNFPSIPKHSFGASKNYYKMEAVIKAWAMLPEEVQNFVQKNGVSFYFLDFDQVKHSLAQEHGGIIPPALKTTTLGMYNEINNTIYIDLNNSIGKILTTFLHEIGHSVFHLISKKLGNKNKIAVWLYKVIEDHFKKRKAECGTEEDCFPTTYSQTSPDEWFAESFCYRFLSDSKFYPDLFLYPFFAEIAMNNLEKDLEGVEIVDLITQGVVHLKTLKKLEKNIPDPVPEDKFAFTPEKPIEWATAVLNSENWRDFFEDETLIRSQFKDENFIEWIEKIKSPLKTSDDITKIFGLTFFISDSEKKKEYYEFIAKNYPKNFAYKIIQWCYEVNGDIVEMEDVEILLDLLNELPQNEKNSEDIDTAKEYLNFIVIENVLNTADHKIKLALPFEKETEKIHWEISSALKENNLKKAKKILRDNQDKVSVFTYFLMKKFFTKKENITFYEKWFSKRETNEWLGLFELVQNYKKQEYFFRAAYELSIIEYELEAEISPYQNQSLF